MTQVDNDFKSLTDGWTIDEFSKKWLEVEEKILIEICHKNMALLQPCEFSPKVLLESFRDSSINIGIYFSNVYIIFNQQYNFNKCFRNAKCS